MKILEPAEMLVVQLVDLVGAGHDARPVVVPQGEDGHVLVERHPVVFGEAVKALVADVESKLDLADGLGEERHRSGPQRFGDLPVLHVVDERPIRPGAAETLVGVEAEDSLHLAAATCDHERVLGRDAETRKGRHEGRLVLIAIQNVVCRIPIESRDKKQPPRRRLRRSTRGARSPSRKRYLLRALVARWMGAFRPSLVVTIDRPSRV